MKSLSKTISPIAQWGFYKSISHQVDPAPRQQIRETLWGMAGIRESQQDQADEDLENYQHHRDDWKPQ